MTMIRWQRVLLALIVCGLVGYLPAGSASPSYSAEGFLDTLAHDTPIYCKRQRPRRGPTWHGRSQPSGVTSATGRPAAT